MLTAGGVPSDLKKSITIGWPMPAGVSASPTYSQAAGACLRSARAFRCTGIIAALVLALPAGGCSYSYKLDALFSKDDKGKEAASLKPGAAAATVARTREGDADLVFAKAAATELLA